MKKFHVYKKVKLLLVEVWVFIRAFQISCFRDEKLVWVCVGPWQKKGGVNPGGLG